MPEEHELIEALAAIHAEILAIGQLAALVDQRQYKMAMLKFASELELCVRE